MLEDWGALVTGGGSGIGLACARRLAQDGAHVVLFGRTPDKLEAAAEQLRSEGHSAAVHAGDTAEEDDVAAASESVPRLRIAIAAAGTGSFGPVVSTTLAQWRAVLDTNLTGTFLTIRHTAPKIAANGGGGIVAISSIAGRLTHRFMAPYSVSKSAIEALVRNAADELGGAGVRVNAVRPGLVPTDLSAPLAASEDVRADYLAQMPIGRLGTTQDVAEAVRYLAGPESGWVTGQILSVDGGHTLRRGPDLTAMARMLFGEEAATRGIPADQS